MKQVLYTCPLGCGYQLRRSSAFLSSLYFSSHSISIAVSLKNHTSCRKSERKMWDVHPWLSAPIEWQSHKSFIFFGCIREHHKISFEMATLSTHAHGKLFLCLQTTARWSWLILLQKAMNKTCIDMHIKRQELTKQNKAKQRCRGREKRGVSFLLNLLWIPNTPHQLAGAWLRGHLGMPPSFILT